MKQQQQQQQTMVTSAGPIQPVNFSQPYQTISMIHSYRHRDSTRIGALLVLAGCLSFIFGLVMNAVVAVDFHVSYYTVATSVIGMMCYDILIIITGVFGILAGRRKSKCKIITFLVLAIIGAICAGYRAVYALVGAYAVHAINDPAFVEHGHVDNNAFHGTTLWLMLIMLGLLGIGEFALCLWGSILCCATGGCCVSQPAVYQMIPAEEPVALAQRPADQQLVVYPTPPEYTECDAK